MNGSSESWSNHVDGSSASHAVRLLHRSLSAQSSCLSLHPVIVPTLGSFHQTTQSSNPQTSKSFTVLKVLPSVHLSNTFASPITVYKMFSVFNWEGRVKNCCFKHCSSFLLRSFTILLWVFCKFLEPNRHLILEIYSDTHNSLNGSN